MPQTAARAGKHAGVSWRPNPGSSTVTYTLNVTDHSWSEQVDTIDVTHTGAAGVQTVIAGILRGEGTVKAFLDATDDTTTFLGTTQQIIAGTKGILTHVVGTTTAGVANLSYTIPAMIVRVNSAVPVAGGVNYDFTIQFDESASTVTYTRDGTV